MRSGGTHSDSLRSASPPAGKVLCLTVTHRRGPKTGGSSTYHFRPSDLCQLIHIPEHLENLRKPPSGAAGPSLSFSPPAPSNYYFPNKNTLTLRVSPRPALR
ncbi:hypothetical protein E2C01_097188 [Portunus trituberculatus]|uniref:Uncharacterized protein n=1 Tax=Portunus trituberculatus TaxID=210409 RepID=A0A5B7JXP0_PORTR|nr:hypothetical protein [Portunus trituberculatus]